ncbi:MAG: hypothetical protein MUD13_12710, partial [Candidatus Nanopelagicales bacterium]|nr:hypothetical protein [Candidatus Nanopelagicales bacterium]
MSAAEVSGAAAAHPREAAALPALERPRGVLGASWRLLRSEMRLILGRRRNQAGLVVLAAVPALIAIAIRIEGPG